MTQFDMDELLNCMHCGFCLPACPTFQLTGLETYSPRGRIGLMKGVAEQRLPIDAEFEKNMYACLGCRACETACPAGVKYGNLIETAREIVEDTKKSRQKQSFTRRIVFKHLFMHPQRLQGMGAILWALQASGMQKIANQTGIMKFFPKEIGEMQTAVDTLVSPAKRRQRQQVIAAEPPEYFVPSNGWQALKVGMFTGCIMDMMFYETNQATIRLLSKAGYTVILAQNQGCCGALHAHSGEKTGAIELAKQNIVAFEQANVDLIVNNAGGCGAALKEYNHWLKDDVEWAHRATEFVSKVRDITELLAASPSLKIEKQLHARVTYQDSCHLAHGQGVHNQPRDLIKRIPGIEYVELPYADTCCGSAGIYNITNYDMSMQILDKKMKHVKSTQAQIIVTTNPGCLLQMKKGIIDAELSDSVEAIHIVDLLNRVI